jgi:Mn2+/Fe2+ NRAMP family transporter
LDPIRLLVYTSVLNGVAAVPLILLIILISRNRRIMGEHASGRLSVGFNWLAFGTMAGATLAALVTLLQGK